MTCRFRDMSDNPAYTRPCRVVAENGTLTGFYFPDKNEMITRHTPGYQLGGMSGQCLHHRGMNLDICPVR